MSRIGIAGLGDIARLHAQGLASHAGVELAVCRGRNPASADVFARDFGAHVYDSYDEMLGDSLVVAVDLCVPNDLHRAYGEAAARARKHVICEKPIAMTGTDASALMQACAAAGVQLFVAHVLRFWPEYQRMREILRSGDLGKCHAVTMRRMLSLLVNVQGREGWRHRPERMGGAVLDLQIHDIDFLLWTFGMPATIRCAAARSADGGLNHVYTTLTFSGGPCALIEASYMLKGDPMVFTAKAVCESGSLDYSMNLAQFGMHDMEGAATRSGNTGPASLTCYRPGFEPEVLVYSDPHVIENAFRAQLGYCADCILGMRRNEVTDAADAVAAVRIAEACRESAEKASVIRFDGGSLSRLTHV